MSRSSVSVARCWAFGSAVGWPPPRGSGRMWVRRMSTRSPGKTKPEIPEVAVTATEAARIPGWRTAAKKPRSPGATIRSIVSGSPATSGERTTQPVKSSGLPAPVTIYGMPLMSSGYGCQARSSGFRIRPGERDFLATRTARTGLSTAGGGARLRRSVSSQLRAMRAAPAASTNAGTSMTIDLACMLRLYLELLGALGDNHQQCDGDRDAVGHGLAAQAGDGNGSGREFPPRRQKRQRQRTTGQSRDQHEFAAQVARRPESGGCQQLDVAGAEQAGSEQRKAAEQQDEREGETALPIDRCVCRRQMQGIEREEHKGQRVRDTEAAQVGPGCGERHYGDEQASELIEKGCHERALRTGPAATALSA